VTLTTRILRQVYLTVCNLSISLRKFSGCVQVTKSDARRRRQIDKLFCTFLSDAAAAAAAAKKHQ